MDQYKVVTRIGEGAHGVVLLARHLKTGASVALKKVAVRAAAEGLPHNTLREVQALREIGDHENVVRLFDVFPNVNGIVLVFECLTSDLQEVLQTHGPLTEAQTKAYVCMLLRGLQYCHAHRIMHRDLKPANLLISKHGSLKIADFGLARVFAKEPGTREYSHQVATRWYRAPELLYGSRSYDEGMDLWAVGCILAELLNNSPLFPGENDIDQMSCVFRVLGTPTPENWPNAASLPDYNKITFDPIESIGIAAVLPEASSTAAALVASVLQFESINRPSAAEMLHDLYFFSDPIPAHQFELPRPISQHEAAAADPDGHAGHGGHPPRHVPPMVLVDRLDL